MKKNPRRHSLTDISNNIGQLRYFADRSAYESTRSALDSYYPREALDEQSFEIRPGLDGQYRDYTDSEKTFFDNVSSFLFGESPVSFKERAKIAFDPVQMWNLWHIRRVGADKSSKEFELEEANYKLEELEKILKYSDLIKDRNNILDLIKLGKDDESKLEKLDELNEDIASLTAYFKTSGRKLDSVIDLLYNTKKIDWGDTKDSNLKLDILAQDLTYNKNKPLDAVDRFKEFFGNLWSSGAESLLNLGDFISGNNQNDRFTKRAIKNSSPDNRLYDKLYEDYNVKSNRDLDLLNERIDSWRKYLERDKHEKETKVVEVNNEYTQGSKLFNPKLVDPRYKTILEQTRNGLLGWLDPTKLALSIPETGSSWSDTKNFVGMMAVNYGANMAASLATLALSKNPELAISTVNGIRAASAAGTLGLTMAMRKHETNSEAMDAQSSKVLNESIKNGVDIQPILAQIENYSQMIGINTEGLTELDMLQLGLAYNTPTDNETFEKIKRDSRKGLNKVINENNALALMDYLKILPFMGFTGQFFREAASAFKPTKLRSITLYEDIPGGFYNYNKPINEFRVLNRKELFDQRFAQMAKADPKFAKAVDVSLNGVLDNAISRVANKTAKDVVNKLKVYQGLQFLKNKAKQLVPLATKEGIEEGQQQLLQNRYGRGEYENYDQPVSMFDIPSAFNTANLAAEAVAAYLGINFGDPDNGDAELRKAMEIGAITGALFRSGHVLSNLVSDLNSKYVAWLPGIDAGDRINTRNLINLWKNDSAIRLVVGESLGKFEDDQHIGTYFDAFSKRGITPERLAKSLQDLKNFKGLLVTDDYIDREIKQMYIAYNVYKNPEVDKLLKDLNIDRDSEQHKDVVRLGTRAIFDGKQIRQLVQEDDAKLNQLLDNILKQSESVINNEEGSANSLNNERSSQLDSILRKITSSFERAKKSINDERQAFVTSTSTQNRAVQNLIDRNSGDTVILEEDDFTPEEIAKEAQRLADEQHFEIPDKDIYVKNRLKMLFNLSRINATKKAIDDLKLQAKRLKLIQEETGTDIDTERLIGMIDVLEEELQNLLKLSKDSVSDINEQIKKANEVRQKLNKDLKRKDKLPLLKEITLEDVFKDYPAFDNQEEINETQYTRAINNAILQVLNPVIEAYSLGRVNPSQLHGTQRTLNWSELSDLQKAQYRDKVMQQWQQQGKGTPSEKAVRMSYINEQNALRNKFKKLKKRFEEAFLKMEQTPEEDRTFDMESDLDELSVEAAKELISFDLAQKIERRKVAHQEWMRDKVLTPNDVEDAMNGDEEATLKVVETIQQENLENLELTQPEQDNESLATVPQENSISAAEFTPESEDMQSDEILDTLDEIMEENHPAQGAELDAYTMLYGKPKNRKPKNKKDEEDSIDLLNDNPDTEEQSLTLDTENPVPANELLEENELKQEEGQPLTDPNKTEPEQQEDDIVEEDEDVEEQSVEDDENEQNSDETQSQSEQSGTNEEPLQNEIPYDNLEIDENPDGSLTLNGVEISDELSNLLTDEQELLTMFDISLDFDSNDMFTNSRGNNDPKTISTSEDAWVDYISLTFFYAYKDENPTVLTVGGNLVTLNKPIGSGLELSRKISKSGWFDSVKKYYVVTGGNKSNKSNADDLTVALVLEDSEKCYVTFLRTPDNIKQKQPDGVISTGLDYIKRKLRFIGVDREKFIESMQDAREMWYHNHIKRQPLDDGRISKDEYQKKVDRWRKDAKDYYEQLSYDNEEQAKIKRLIEYDARNRAKISIKGISGRIRTILTEELIDEQIDKLKQSRKEIIDAYCIKNEDGTYTIPLKENKPLTHVHPENPRISNGKFNTNPRTNGLPTFKKLTGKDAGFGLSDDLEILTQQLIDKKVEFGYGTGRHSADPQAIIDLMSDKKLNDSSGYAGKIYAMVTGPSGVSVPVTLREERFNQQEGRGFIHRQTDNLVLAIDPSTGRMSDSSVLPSAAEVILYMITGRLNVDYMPAGYANVMLPLLDLIVHNGEKTLTTINGNKPSLLNKFTFYADKRFAWMPVGNKEEYKLSIVTKNKNGYRIQRHYTAEDLFGEGSEDLRKDVIYTIAENMHWNTDKVDMVKKLDNQILEALQAYFTRYKNATEFRICGLQQFTFKKEDLFEVDKKGNITKAKNTSVFAWMLNNGKILTDLQPEHFKDSFVFANGVQVDENAKVTNVVEQNLIPKLKKQNEQKPASVIEATSSIAAQQEQIERFKSRFGVRAKDADALIARTEEIKDKILQQYSTSSGVLSHGGMRDILILDIQPDKIKEIKDWDKRGEELKKQLKSALEKYADYLKKSKNVDISIDNIKMPADVSVMQILKLVISNKITPVLYMYNDGVGSIRLIQSNELLGTVRGVTGVFSKIKSGGKLNEKRARSWISKTLGLSDAQVTVENAVWQATSDELIYGITDLSLNVLSDTLWGTMRLSRQAGRGLHYHEAWHYVNLLLHSPQERAYIYRKYIENHPDLKHSSFKEIEEAMAEDFRKYMEMKNEYNISNILKRIGNYILDLIHVFDKPNEVQYIYDQIRNGKYAKATLNEDSIKEFKRRFPNGVYNAPYTIPGTPARLINKLKNITSPDMFYRVGESLAHMIIDRYDLKTVGDIKSVQSGMFTQFIEDLKIKNEVEGNPVIDDIVQNPEAFKHIIYNMFAQYGLEPKFKRIKSAKVLDENQEGDLEGAHNAEERAEPLYDIDRMLVSLKDNVAFRAKLFLSRQRRTRFDYDDISGERILVTDYDSVLGSPLYMSFDETWVEILLNLWDIESYDKKDEEGNYEETSLRGKVRRLMAHSPFFAELDRRLDTLYDDEGNPDIELRNQIYCTVKKSNPQVAFFELQKIIQKSKTLYMDSDESQMISKSPKKAKADRNKEWLLQNSNALRAIRNLPRQWSKEAMVSGLVTIDNNKTVVSGAYVDMLYGVIDDLWDYIKKPKKSKKVNKNSKYPTTDEAKSDVYEMAAERIVKVLNLMGIPSDRLVFDFYIQMHLDKPNDFGNISKKFEVLCDVLSTGKNAGNIRDILASLLNSVGKTEIQMARGKTKPIDQVYYGYKLDSEISKYVQAYREIYPSASDFSVIGPDGAMIYPMNDNNHMSDELRRLNYNINGRIEQMKKSPYALNSILLRAASEIDHSNPFKDEMLKLNAFVGIKDEETQDGQNYKKITPLEDYLAKLEMTFRDLITLPTMADKPTWYALESKNVVLPHDLITWDQNDESGKYLARRFSNRTLNIFAGYFIDELNSLEQYYSRENIKYLVENPNKRIVNFHGKVENGRMTFDGNGGKFRYFYDMEFLLDDNYSNTKQYINLNQFLEFVYKKQQMIEQNPVAYGGKAQLRELNNPNEDLDGFELVRQAIQQIRDKFLSDTDESKTLLYDSINRWLMSLVDEEMYVLGTDESLKVGEFKQLQDGSIRFLSTAIPRHLLQYYSKEFQKAGLFSGKMIPYYSSQYDYDFTLSAIANHVASTMISIIETEKVFTGDPAYYKWKHYDKLSTKITLDGFTIDVSVLKEKHSDKIKRLGSVLSPGSNLRSLYSEEELRLLGDLNGSKYTVMNISDVSAKTKYLEEVKIGFERQAFVDYIELYSPKWWHNYVKESGKNEHILINELYRDNKKYSKAKHYAEEQDASLQLFLAERTNMAISPYDYDKKLKHKGINVSDAEVIIRPALYRKIRISLGEWTVIPDEDGYSDEEAYKIVESDPNWMKDPEKYKKVLKLQLYPLKMTYFDNGSRVISTNGDDVRNYQNVPVYNKMAIFPAFKFLFSSDTGMDLYERMNMEANEIDMIAFESAVKVGDNLEKWSPFPKGVESLDDFNDGLFSRSDQFIIDGKEEVNQAKDGEKLLPVQIQDLNGLRLQQNTEAHTATERSIGTQAFKIMFSNILDDVDYGLNKVDENGKLRKTRKGKHIKRDIMACIHAMTHQGVLAVKEEFYSADGKIKQEAVQKWVQKIAKNNGLGISAEEILSDGVVASLMSRRLFEQSVSSLVNKEVVNINLNGGSAIQLSLFGFVGYGKRSVYSDEYYRPYNNGEQLKWNKYDGSMEVILSLNFFRSVVPQEYQDTPDRMRQWLIDHDVIKGLKSKEYWQLSEGDASKLQLLDTEVVGLDFSVRLLNILQKSGVNTVQDIIDKKDVILLQLGKKLQSELNDSLEALNLSWDTERPEIKPVYSKPKPYGVGYRIPTQGMSSTFAFTVADVLPQQSGDVIIVPAEFTAQTGSDFDVDKLYIATYSYTDGQLDIISEEATKALEKLIDSKLKNKQKLIAEILSKESHGAVQNRLLDNYIDVISDIKMFANARQSIDVITNLILDEILPIVNKQYTTYRKAGYELLPSFQARTKMEFSTGKDGIGPFALNITNLALTQFMNLTMDYGDNEFEFGRLDAIKDLDGLRISDWLSAMVNAHVDVAKDPYVFALNVNKETYNHVNFLLRAGKGISTFTFIAQPILKKYANLVNIRGGVYGQNIDGKSKGKSKTVIYNELFKEAVAQLKAVKNQIEQDESLSEEQKSEWRIRIANILNKKIEPKEWKYVFDVKLGKYAILHENTYRGRYMQLLSLMAFDKMSKYADELSELVLVSKIDTKKFGNNIASQLNFKNRYEQFKYGDHKVSWFIGEKEDKETSNSKNKSKKLEKQSQTKSALTRYFSVLFLDSKFYNATNLVKYILRKLTYTSTEVYEDLFNGIFSSLYDAVEWEDADNKTITGYVPVLNDDIVLSIGQSIDNIIRFRSIFKFGSKFKIKPELRNNNLGPIDFTCDGDPISIQNEIRRILFGDDKSKDELDKNDLFTNLSRLIHDIQEDPTSDIASGLVNEQGEIKNEFLLFLRPLTASEDFSIGRMLLRKSLMDVAVEQKSRLISDFDLLLRHQNERVRRIARDIAFYAYYSTYDTNTVNSFFDLVPKYYRLLYDYAMKKGLNVPNEVLSGALCSDIFDNIDVTNESHMAESFLDLISRNYWYNNDIVPEYTERHGQTKDIHRYNELQFVTEYINGQTVNGIIVTTNANKKPYIKIQKGDDWYLYRLVGNINKTKNSGSVMTSYGVYFIVPKLGLHSGKIHQYEFYNGSKLASVFDENALPDRFAVYETENNDGLDKEFSEFFESIKPNKQEQKDGIKYVYMSNPKILLNGTYYLTDYLTSANVGVVYNNNNTIKFVPTNNIEEYLMSMSDFVVDIDKNTHDGAAFIKSTDSIDKIISTIKLKLNGRNTETNPLRLYISGSLDSISVTKQDIKEYIEQQVEEYLAREENPDEQAYRKQLENTSEETVKQYKQNEFINNLIVSLMSSGIYINDLFTDGLPGLGEAVAKSAYYFTEEFATENKYGATIAVPKSFEINSEDYYDFVDNFHFNKNDITLSMKEQLGVINIENVVKLMDEQLDSIQKEAEDLQSNNNVETQVGDLESDVVLDISSLFGDTSMTDEVKEDLNKSNDTNLEQNPENATNAADLLKNLNC